MRFLTLEFFKQLHRLPRSKTFYALEDDKLLAWRKVQQVCFKAPAMSLVFETLEDQTAHCLEIEQPAMFRAEALKLDEEENYVHREAPFRVELCLEEGSRRFQN